MKMLVTEWDFERKLAVVGEEHYQTGRMEERYDNIRSIYQAGFSVEVIAKALNLPEQTVKDILDSQTR